MVKAFSQACKDNNVFAVPNIFLDNKPTKIIGIKQGGQMKEFNLAQLKNYAENSFQLIDIRDEGSVICEMIPGAIHIAFSQFEKILKIVLEKYRRIK